MANLSQPQRSPAKTWRQRWDELPQREPENSILLRVLTQLLVIVGIIATDIAASDVSEWQVTSYWAIPLSLIGAAWSWRQRRHRNIPTQFCLAIGMLLTLAAFLLRLVGELNDTRLALAQLLIQLQVLHSFDLPRRKDLGYSMVIGLILIGVAGTLSQTLAFGPILLVFVAIAIPVLVLDYRSRLGLVFRSFKLHGTDLAPKRLGLFLALLVGLGLTIFMFLPRLPGYQLRTFPVSSPVEFRGQFDNTRILNPGYVGQGNQRTDEEGGGTGGAGSGQGQGTQQGQGRGPGQLDPNYYYGFDTQINQNLRGELKPRVVMRVRSQSEGFWRVMAFDKYNGQGWEVSRNDQANTIDRPTWTYQFYLPQTVTTQKTREVVQTYTVVTEELPNVIPALFQPKELYFPTRQVGIDPEGTLRSPLALVEGFTYTVISEVPYRDRTRLRQASTLYPTSFRKYYLQTLPKAQERIRRRTEEILATSPNPLPEPYEKALYLADYLKKHYAILPELPFFGDNEDMVEAFLFTYEGGYPDHFSTALTVMLRSIGIPARLVTGFGPGEFNPFTGLYVVRNTDAYAVTEVFFPRYGWFAFDPIPGHDLFPPSIEEYQTFSLLQRFWQWVAGWLPSPVSAWLNTIFSWMGAVLGRVIGWFLGLFAQGWVGIFVALLVATCVGFLGWLAWQGWQGWRYQRWLARLAPMERLYQQMLGWLAKQGLRKRPSQTPLEYAIQVAQQQPAMAIAINEISQAYVRWRYGGQEPNLRYLQQQLQQLQRQTALRQFQRRPRRPGTSIPSTQ